VNAVPPAHAVPKAVGPRLAVLARAVWAVGAGLTALPAAAQVAGGLRITPSLETTVSAVHQSSGLAQGDDALLQVHPGVQITAGGGRLRGRLDYGLNAIYRSQSAAGQLPGQGQGESLQNNLNAALNAELVERWLFVDTTATIAQQAISAYGQQSVDGTQLNANRTEVSQVSIRPHAQGSLAGWMSYQVGLSADISHAQGSAAADSRNTGLNLTLGSPRSGTVFGWSVLGTQQNSNFGGRSTDSGRLLLSLLIRPDPDWNASLRGGQETTSMGSLYRQTYNNWGGDLRWTPSPRSTLLVSTDERYFGRSHQVLLEHRFANSSLRYTSNRGASNDANGAGVGQPVTVYQMFYAQLASAQPDPTLRDQLVRDTLLALHLDGNAVVAGGYAYGGATLQRRDDLSITYVGRRSSFTLQAFSSDTRRIDTTTPGVDTTPVRQQGLTGTVSYRLTPTANLNFSGSGLRTASTATQAGNRLKSGSLSWSQQLSKFVSLSAMARYSAFDGDINPYRESALSASLSLRF
jgi:uncharacterized protein (PEP-CTERM system associated)